MKVQTKRDHARIVAIGKTLESYDAIDTGIFVRPPEIFHYLARARKNGDCSLADGQSADGGGRQGARDRYRRGVVAGCRRQRDAGSGRERRDAPNGRPSSGRMISSQSSELIAATTPYRCRIDGGVNREREEQEGKTAMLRCESDATRRIAFRKRRPNSRSSADVVDRGRCQLQRAWGPEGPGVTRSSQSGSRR